MKPLNVGLLGFGTVGKGTWDVLRRNEEEISRRAGRPKWRSRSTWRVPPLECQISAQ